LQKSSIEDKDQTSRMEVLQKFKLGIYHVLVATDVATHGLDIKNKSIVNFDISKDIISIRTGHRNQGLSISRQDQQPRFLAVNLAECAEFCNFLCYLLPVITYEYSDYATFLLLIRKMF
jgi:hypothetical protein